MKLPQVKKQIGAFTDDIAIEAVQSVSDGVKDTFKKDLGKQAVSEMMAQILGSSESNKKSAKHGEMHEGQEIDLKNAHKELSVHIEAAYDYREEILHGEKRIHAEDSRETQIKIQEIMIELKKVVESSKELQNQFKEVSVQKAPQKVGKYHLNFVEWMLQNVREIRMQIEDSGAWLSAMKSKKDKKGYWGMFKKHGTSFGLSNERSVATQVG